MESHSISVVYLCWLPYGVGCLETFLNLYKRFNAGINHELVITFKGGESQNDILPFEEVLHANQVAFKSLYYTGKELDISTYHWAAGQLTTEFVFFLNTRSQILKANWLASFYNATKTSSLTVLCATGSWQSYASSVFKQHSWAYEKTKPFQQNFSKYKLLIKAATLWWFYFPLFPNPHIRTNAFFINRQLFLSLKIGKIISKIDAYRFESGRSSFTRQLKSKGYKVELVAGSGEIFGEEDWRASKIFWMNEQTNLLIADNQTELYSSADKHQKKQLEGLAWG